MPRPLLTRALTMLADPPAPTRLGYVHEICLDRAPELRSEAASWISESSTPSALEAEYRHPFCPMKSITSMNTDSMNERASFLLYFNQA